MTAKGDRPTVADVKQWEIWHVQWPHGDGTSKGRFALAVSTSADNAAKGFARFVYITSKDHPEIPCRLGLCTRDPSFVQTGLSSNSWVHFLDTEKLTDERLDERVGKINALSAAYARVQLRNLGVGPE